MKTLRTYNIAKQLPNVETDRLYFRTCLKKKNPTQKLMFMLNHWSSKILT